MLTSFQYNKKLTILILIFSIIHLPFINGQITGDAHLDPLIKERIIKYITLNEILLRKKLVNSESNSLIVHNYFLLDYPGFGFLPDEIECTIEPIRDIAYPNDKIKLYNVSFLDNAHNNSLFAWDAGMSLFKFKQNLLVGINSSQDVLCISGCGIDYSIINDFSVDEKEPESFLPFLYLKFFSHQFDTIKFLRKQENFIVFLMSKQKEGGISKYEYYIDPNDPESSVRIEYVGDTMYSKTSIKRNDTKFKDFEDKKNTYLMP
jgi:hypothetical protein